MFRAFKWRGRSISTESSRMDSKEPPMAPPKEPPIEPPKEPPVAPCEEPPEEPDEEPIITSLPRRPTRKREPIGRDTRSLLMPIDVNNNPDEFTRFLDRYFMIGDRVLHLGCQSGSICFNIAAKVLPSGLVVGISGPGQDNKVASELTTRAGLEKRIVFVDIQDMTKLPFDDGHFDIAYASDIMARLPASPTHTKPIELLEEMKRVTRPGGLIATRDLATQFFFPSEDLANLITRTVFLGTGLTGWYGPIMPELYTRIGLPNFSMSTSTSSVQGSAMGKDGWAEQVANLFGFGSDMRERWIAAGVSEAVIDLISTKMIKWGQKTNSWYVCLYTEMLAKKEPLGPSAGDEDATMDTDSDDFESVTIGSESDNNGPDPSPGLVHDMAPRRPSTVPAYYGISPPAESNMPGKRSTLDCINSIIIPKACCSPQAAERPGASPGTNPTGTEPPDTDLPDANLPYAETLPPSSLHDDDDKMEVIEGQEIEDQENGDLKTGDSESED